MVESGSKEKGADVRFPPPLIFLLFFLLGLLLQFYVMSLSFPFARLASITLGAVSMSAGAALPITARMHFKRTGQSVKPWDPTPALIFAGPYRFTRNPMYLGLTTFQIGLGLLLNYVWVSVMALPALALVHVMAVVPEERYLSEKFGDTYRGYLGRVRRYL